MNNFPPSSESFSLDTNFLEKNYYYKPDGSDNLQDDSEEISVKLGFKYKKSTEDGTASSSNLKKSVQFDASTTIKPSATTAESSSASTAADKPDTTDSSSNFKNLIILTLLLLLKPLLLLLLLSLLIFLLL